MDGPLFSIITPAYNCGDKLGETIESVLNQPEGLAEMIVVDGGSTDAATRACLARYEGRIRVISEPDKGLYDAMNKGIGLARGRYLNFQGAGDLLRPGALAQLAPQIPEGPLWFVYGRVYLKTAKREQGEPFTKMTLRNGNIPHQGVFYERSIFDLVGRYDLAYKTGADYVMAMRCYREAGIHKKYVDLVIADYEGGGVSETAPETKLDRDLPKLILRNLGPGPFLVWLAAKLVPMSIRDARVRRLKGS